MVASLERKINTDEKNISMYKEKKAKTDLNLYRQIFYKQILIHIDSKNDIAVLDVYLILMMVVVMMM
jgi:hypothetical protein